MFEKDKRLYLANARKTEKAIEARKLAITKQIELEKKMIKRATVTLPKTTTTKEITKTVADKTGENNVSNDDNGEINIRTPTATLEPTAFPKHPVRMRRER